MSKSHVDECSYCLCSPFFDRSIRATPGVEGRVNWMPSRWFTELLKLEQQLAYVKSTSARVILDKMVLEEQLAAARNQLMKMTDNRDHVENAYVKLQQERDAANARIEKSEIWCGCGDAIRDGDNAACGVCVMMLEDSIKGLEARIAEARNWLETYSCEFSRGAYRELDKLLGGGKEGEQ